MTPEASKSIWSDTKVLLMGRSYPNLGLAVAIFVAVALVFRGSSRRTRRPVLRTHRWTKASAIGRLKFSCQLKIGLMLKAQRVKTTQTRSWNP